MNNNDENLLRDIIGALSTAVVVVCRSVEREFQKAQPNFNRRSVIVALQGVARDLPVTTSNRLTIKAILENIAVELESGDRRASTIPLGAKKE